MPEISPTESIPVISGFGKIFPIFWDVVDFKFKTPGEFLRNLLMILSFLIYIPLIWPIESLSSFLGTKRSIILFRKIPKTTVWEVVTSLTIFCIGFGALMVIVVVFACVNSKSFFEKILLFTNLATGSLNIDCGF